MGMSSDNAARELLAGSPRVEWPLPGKGSNEFAFSGTGTNEIWFEILSPQYKQTRGELESQNSCANLQLCAR